MLYVNDTIYDQAKQSKWCFTFFFLFLGLVMHIVFRNVFCTFFVHLYALSFREIFFCFLLHRFRTVVLKTIIKVQKYPFFLVLMSIYVQHGFQAFYNKLLLVVKLNYSYFGKLSLMNLIVNTRKYNCCFCFSLDVDLVGAVIVLNYFSCQRYILDSFVYCEVTCYS